jgi:hypothetical protein
MRRTATDSLGCGHAVKRDSSGVARCVRAGYKVVARCNQANTGAADTGTMQYGDTAMDSTMTQFELRFRPLSESSRSFAFPCDPQGRVNMDQLSNRTRNNYLYARAMVGRELAMPAVRPASMH